MSVRGRWAFALLAVVTAPAWAEEVPQPVPRAATRPAAIDVPDPVAPPANLVGPPSPRQVTIPAPVIVPETVVVPPQTSEVLPPPQPVRRRRLELLWGGVGAFTVAYVSDRFLTRDLSQGWQPWLPVLGPWFLLAQQRQLADPSNLTATLLVVDGVLQVGGVVLISLGASLRKDRMVQRLPPEAKEGR